MKKADVTPASAPKISHDRLRLSAMRVAMIAPFMAKGDPRYYLNGVNVRPHPDGGAVIAATNGSILGAVHDKMAICEHEVTLQLSSGIVTACRTHRSDLRELVMLKGRLAVVQAEQEVCIQPGDPVIAAATFPEYERMLPAANRLKPGLHGHFQARYLATLQEAIKVVKQDRLGLNSLTFFHVDGDTHSVGIARTAVLEEFVALLMPLRAEAPATSVPGWAATAGRIEKAAA